MHVEMQKRCDRWRVQLALATPADITMKLKSLIAHFLLCKLSEIKRTAITSSALLMSFIVHNPKFPVPEECCS